MALIELDESWEEYDSEEERRRLEKFPLIERDKVRAQVTNWDEEVSKKGNPMIVWEMTVINDSEYSGKTINLRTPTTGRGKYVLRNFLEASGVKRIGKTLEPEKVLGKVVTLHLSIGVTDDGRKFTQVDGVTS